MNIQTQRYRSKNELSKALLTRFNIHRTEQAIGYNLKKDGGEEIVLTPEMKIIYRGAAREYYLDIVAPG